MCEIEEAGYEYAKGDHKACVAELVQCAAVIMRMIDMVQAEHAEGKKIATEL